jgi:hypothetical protein
MKSKLFLAFERTIYAAAYVALSAFAIFLAVAIVDCCL